MTYLRWAFWSLWYLPRSSPKTFNEYLAFVSRTRKPWVKFKPFVIRSEMGRFWEVFLKEQEPVFTFETIKCDVGRDAEGNVVCLKIHDIDIKNNRR